MLTVLIVSQILSWIVILGLGLALLALARQVGVLHVRLAPAGALLTGKGPVVGEPAPVLDAMTLDGAALAIGKPLAAGRNQLLLFVSPHCPLVQGSDSHRQEFRAGPKSWTSSLSATMKQASSAP